MPLATFCTAWFVSNLGVNPEDRFSQHKAYIDIYLYVYSVHLLFVTTAPTPHKLTGDSLFNWLYKRLKDILQCGDVGVLWSYMVEKTGYPKENHQPWTATTILSYFATRDLILVAASASKCFSHWAILAPSGVGWGLAGQRCRSETFWLSPQYWGSARVNISK